MDEDESIWPSCRDEACSEPGIIAGRCPGHAIRKYRVEAIRDAPTSFKPPSESLPDCTAPRCRYKAIKGDFCPRHRKQMERRGQVRPIAQRRQAGAASLRDGQGRKQCSMCLEWREPDDFSKHPTQEDGLQPTCRPCYRFATYSITDEQYAALLSRQGGVCAVCRLPDGFGRSLSVDHDHLCCSGARSCGQCVRGLLCNRCNQAMGRFRDSAERLREAADYVEAWRRQAPRAVPSPPAGRKDSRWYIYKVTPEGYTAMLASQQGACALCGTPPGARALAVDHDHSCCPREGRRGATCGQCVRGLLCTNCNVGLGTFDEDLERLRRAAEYVGTSLTRGVAA